MIYPTLANPSTVYNISAVKRTEFIAKFQQYMTVKHCVFKSALYFGPGFWLGWRKDVELYYRHCENSNCYHRRRFPRTVFTVHAFKLQSSVTDRPPKS